MKFYTSITTFLFFILSACTSERDPSGPTLEDMVQQGFVLLHEEDVQADAVAQSVTEVVPEAASKVVEASKPVDIYAGAQSWCESPILKPCTVKEDCAGMEHPSGKELQCVRPYYVDPGSEYKVCWPGWASRAERDAQRDRIDALVEARAYPHSNSKNLAKFLKMVSLRETTLRTWKRHRLNDDLRANRGSWHRYARFYGHTNHPGRTKGRIGAAKLLPEGNKYYRDSERWHTGIGLYGMNAALFAYGWDPEAPPEVLCDDIISTEVYMRRARIYTRKLNGGIDCDKEKTNGREFHGSSPNGKPTLYDIHRAVSGGKACPGGREIGNVRERARKAKVDLDVEVSRKSFLKPIEFETQEDTLLELRALLDTTAE